MKKLVIVGASGHGEVVADIAKLNGYDEIVFIDNDESVNSCAGYPIIGGDELIYKLEGEIIIAVGKSATRKRLMDEHRDRIFPTLIHPSAVVAEGVSIGKGTVVMAGAVINPGSTIGKGCIINTSCSIDHDCIIDDYCHISVGSHLSGSVIVGRNTWIGAGAIVSNNIAICGDCMIGVGAVVVRDIKEKGTYIGVPAHKK